MRGTPDRSNSPPCSVASTARAAVSGRIAVPALPRNSLACFVDKHAADARHVQHGAVATQAAAERLEGGQHHAGVVGIEQVVHRRRAGGQAGQQQHAVGDALRAGQAHAAGGRAQGRDVEEGDRVHGQKWRMFSVSV
jgi:hypothetical protein